MAHKCVGMAFFFFRLVYQYLTDIAQSVESLKEMQTKWLKERRQDIVCSRVSKREQLVGYNLCGDVNALQSI